MSYSFFFKFPKHFSWSENVEALQLHSIPPVTLYKKEANQRPTAFWLYSLIIIISYNFDILSSTRFSFYQYFIQFWYFELN